MGNSYRDILDDIYEGIEELKKEQNPDARKLRIKTIRALINRLGGYGRKFKFEIDQLNIQPGEAKLNKKSIKVSKSKITGNIVIADKIDNSFNTVKNAQISDDLKTTLKELHDAVKELSGNLPVEKQNEVAGDLAAFSEEAVSPKPRRPFYEITAKGLIDAAKAVGSAGAKIISTVDAALRILEKIS